MVWREQTYSSALRHQYADKEEKKQRHRFQLCPRKCRYFILFFLSVELKFWFIYNIMCFPLASKITTLKVYEKNMWWIYLPISESKTTSKSRKMKSSCWKALKIRFVPRGHVRGEEIKLQCHIFCYWKDIRSRPWNVCFWWSPCYQLVQKPFWNDKLWPNKKLLKLSQHSIDLLLVMLQRKKKKRHGKTSDPHVSSLKSLE